MAGLERRSDMLFTTGNHNTDSQFLRNERRYLRVRGGGIVMHHPMEAPNTGRIRALVAVSVLFSLMTLPFTGAVGTVDYDEFIRGVRGEMSDRRKRHSRSCVAV